MSIADTSPTPAAPAAPPLSAWIPVAAMFGSLAMLLVPMYVDLAETTWGGDSQGHAPIILALTLWLIYRERNTLMAVPEKPAYFAGFVSLGIGLVLYAIGHSQAMITVEAACQPFLYASAFLLLRGWGALRLVWFPIIFLVFTIPLPGLFVQMITVPLKLAVSTVAEFFLYHAGYPVARTGVILSIGQYQLLVADACSGLASIFTLEALGLLYMKLMDYKNPTHNTVLAVAVVPIAFTANVARVVILVLITYYLGDEVGQGFMHGFAGMVLFMVGLSMLLGLDALIQRYFKLETPPARAAQPTGAPA